MVRVTRAGEGGAAASVITEWSSEMSRMMPRKLAILEHYAPQKKKVNVAKSSRLHDERRSKMVGIIGCGGSRVSQQEEEVGLVTCQVARMVV